MAPPFTLTLVDGTTVTSTELRGQVIVLNYWATWCGPCKAELPMLNRVYQLRKDRGLRVFAVATEDSLPNYRLKKLFDLLAIPAVRKVKGPYGVLEGVPTNYVIDRNGRVRLAQAGALDLADMNAKVLPLLDQRAR